MKAYNIAIILIISAAVIVLPCQARAELEDFRAHNIQPDSCDYVFTAIVSGSSATPRLSFNDHSSRTHFARVGEKVGSYTVKSFTPRSETKFYPSVNTYRVERTGTVVLEGSRGEIIALDQDERVALPGYKANVVLLNTGNHRCVREGESATFEKLTVDIMTISKDSVIISLDNSIRNIPLISEPEVIHVKGLVNEERQRSRKRRMVARTREKEKLKQREQALSQWHKSLSDKEDGLREREASMKRLARTNRLKKLSSNRSGLFVGTECRHPSSYSIIYPSSGWTGSSLGSHMVVPTSFKTYTTTGMGGCGTQRYNHGRPNHVNSGRRHGRSSFSASSSGVRISFGL